MILDALQKVNSSLNNTSKSLMNEDLKSILNIHHFGLDKALQIANNGNKFSNPITYLKFKVIDALKDLELSKKILGSYFKEQLTKIEEAIENPIVRQQILEENLFKVKNNDKHIKVDSFVEVAILHEIGSQEGKDEVLTAHRTINSNLGIKRKVLNPFSGVVVDLEMQIDQMHTMHGNRVLTMDKKYHDVNSLHVVQVTTQNDKSFNLSDDSNYNKLVNFEFTLYHELAHASYNQMSKTKEDDRNSKELHSDLCAIVKIIKNHDLTGRDALNLCGEVFNFRLDSAVPDQYFNVNDKAREHFTEVGIIQFTSILSKNMDKVKNLKDNEISHFVETFVQEAQNKELKILPEMDNKKEFVTKLVDKFIKENIGDDFHNIASFNAYAANARSKLFEKNPYNTKDLYDETKKENIYKKMKNNMINNMMDNETILMDVYLQNKQLEIGKDKLFVQSLIKHMPDGQQLAADTFDKFELYKQLSVDLNSIKNIKDNDKILADNTNIKIKPN
jgi:hypothetical protein